MPLSEDFRVDAEPSKAKSLPAAAFTSPEFLSLEFDTIFACTWLLAHAPNSILDQEEQRVSVTEFLRNKGARVPFSLLGKPLFLQRDLEAELRCFPNVCTHAWYPLVDAPTVERSIGCHQHGRQFDTRGRFLSQAGFTDLPDFPRESDNLTNLAVEEWAPFFFVCLRNPIAPLGEFLKEMQASVPGLSISEFKLHSHPAEVRVVDGNWKQHAWNYLDNFHIRFIHAGEDGLSQSIDLSSYRTELYRFSSLQWAYARDPNDGFDPKQLSPRFRDEKNPDKRVFALWWFIFPNLALNFYPWGLSVNVYMPIPERPSRTQFLWFHYVFDDEKYRRRKERWLTEQVDQEDVEAIRMVARGAQSGFAPRGRFAPQLEAGPHWFHRLVYELAFGTRPSRLPAS